MIQYAIAWQPHSDNLGDDLRTLAAMELMPRVDRVLNADCLDAPIDGLADEDRVIALLSGNMLRETAHWLPEKHIAPVCVGIHLSQEDVWGVAFDQLDGAGKAYLAACAPIGCRDERTVRLMQRTGVPHRLTACLTLTLRRPQVQHQSHICCVDVPGEVVDALRSYAAGAEIRVMTHQLTDPDPDFDARMDQVRAVLRTYASARFVVTRRLHCAMACLAVGTPVLLLYNSDYEDVTRFAPMDQMVRTMPVESFLRQLHQQGLPEPWTNPMGLDAWQETIASAVSEGLRAAQDMPLPIVPDDAAQLWRAQRLRQLAVSSAGKINRLEQQHFKALHEKFSFIMREDAAKGVLSALLDEPEVRLALRKAARRRVIRAYPLLERPGVWMKIRTGKLPVEDLYAQAQEQLMLLGWPEEQGDQQ